MSSATEVIMPLMGEGITEATLVKWLKKVGEAVRKDEPLLEVSTDKVDTEIPAPASGFLTRTFADGGATVAVNAVIAEIADSAAGAATPVAKKRDPEPVMELSQVQTSAGSGAAAAGSGAAAAGSGAAAAGSGAAAASSGAAAAGRGAAAAGSGAAAAGSGTAAAGSSAAPTGNAATAFAASAASSTGGARGARSSPLVRKIAKEHNVDWRQVPGTGLGGRITKKDWESFQSAGAAKSAPAAARAAGSAHLDYGRLETRRDGSRELLDGVAVRREPMTKMRSLIAEHMVRSVRTSPHVTTVFEIDMHRVTQYREKAKAAFQAREGFALNYTAFFVHAAVQAIKKHPIVNVSVDGNDILWKDQINVGVAVAIETGLIVPVIKNAGELNLLGIARRINDVAARARSKKLTPDDVQGGTFSITNPGMFGSIVSAPIINQPQVAILSIGAIVKRPVVINDLIGIRPLVQVGLTFDHRVVDGEGGARYLASLKELLENFNEAAV